MRQYVNFICISYLCMYTKVLTEQFYVKLADCQQVLLKTLPPQQAKHKQL